MCAFRLERRKNLLGALSRNFEIERIWTEVHFVSPGKFAKFTYADAPKDIGIIPYGKDSLACVAGQIDNPLLTVVKGQLDFVAFQAIYLRNRVHTGTHLFAGRFLEIHTPAQI